MSPWSLIIVPLSLAVVVGILIGMAWFEQRVLSAPALLRYKARSHHVGPDTIEMAVVAYSEPLLRNLNKSG
ncbi:MAG: hypothetical protein ACRD12_12875 [Acidimicrobiales bacterium]